MYKAAYHTRVLYYQFGIFRSTSVWHQNNTLYMRTYGCIFRGCLRLSAKASPNAISPDKVLKNLKEIPKKFKSGGGSPTSFSTGITHFVHKCSD